MKWHHNPEISREFARELMGLIPTFLSEANPASAREQLHVNYAHGGGWHPFKGFTYDPTTKTLHYPGDPVVSYISYAHLRDEVIIIFEHAWVAIVQPDGTYEIARMD